MASARACLIVDKLDVARGRPGRRYQRARQRQLPPSREFAFASLLGLQPYQGLSRAEKGGLR